MKTFLVTLFLLVPISLGVAEVRARQATPNTVDLWGGAAAWSGKDAEGFETGPATGATVLFHMGLPVQLGFDLGFARIGTDLSSVHVDEFSGSLVARYRFPFLERMRPFVGMRAGYTRLSAEADLFRLEWNGLLVGGGAGLEIPMGQRVMLTATGEAMYYDYNDASLFLQGVPVPSSGGRAWRYWGRLGLSFRWRN